MTKRVYDVGNCFFDHGKIARVLQERFDVEVLRLGNADELAAALKEAPADLILVNRVLARGRSDGVELIRRFRAEHPQWAGLPVMLVSDYSEFQDEAVRVGAERGFGKEDLRRPQPLWERLAPYLDGRAETSPEE